MLRRESSRPLQERLAEGQLLGTFVKLPALEAIDMVAETGLDFALIDLEHSQLSEEGALRLVRHAFARELPAIVRVPTCERGQVNRVLEAGASGIQLSSVRSVKEVRALVAASRYPPAGQRSVSLAHPVAGYGAVPLREAVTGDPPLLVGQIETAETDDRLEDILSAGLDVAFLGMVDLEVEVGFDRTKLEARVEEVAEAARVAGIPLGAYAATANGVPEGVRYVALSSDVSLLRTAMANVVAEARGRS